jgi:Cu/Ag efflux protein CusF
MRNLRFCIAALAVGAMAFQASAAEYTKGVVKKVDLEGKKVTIIHEELKSLEMPAMTMVFRTADDAMLQQVKEGQEIEFIADRVNGKITITVIK